MSNLSGYHVANFRLEDFGAEGFDGMSRVYLDKMGILEEEHRAILMDKFATHNVFDPSAKHSDVKHKTKGRYNRTEQMDTLLADSDRCIKLKQQTTDLDYLWTR